MSCYCEIVLQMCKKFSPLEQQLSAAIPSEGESSKKKFHFTQSFIFNGKLFCAFRLLHKLTATSTSSHESSLQVRGECLGSLKCKLKFHVHLLFSVFDYNPLHLFFINKFPHLLCTTKASMPLKRSKIKAKKVIFRQPLHCFHSQY